MMELDIKEYPNYDKRVENEKNIRYRPQLKKYQVRIRAKGKRIVYYFDTLEEAIKHREGIVARFYK